MSKPTILCAGEALWDVLPGGEFIGGAPFNVAGHAARLGARSQLAARLGQDARGRRAFAAAQALGIDTSLMQADPLLPTGEARAVLDATGSAHYEFLSPAAWDALELTPQLLAAAAQCDAFVFGTLGQRSARSRIAITQLAATARYCVFDPNLRAPHISREWCEAGLRSATLVKLNEDECRSFAQWFGCEATAEALWATLSERFNISALCITLGAAGSRLNWQGRWYRQAAMPAQIADTVGAGDAFLAMLVCELLGGEDAAAALYRASRLAAHVASQPGAVPDYDPEIFRA